MNPLYFDDLRDIHGLDSISWWPLAPGYWLLLLGIFLSLWLLRTWLRQGDWRVDARQQVQALWRRRTRLTAKELSGEFSELLRRIAVARYGREACAGLHGEAWLSWLEAHDPRGFPWTDAGKILLSLPYAPASTQQDSTEIPILFRALRGWVNAELPETQARKQQWKNTLQQHWQGLKTRFKKQASR